MLIFFPFQTLFPQVPMCMISSLTYQHGTVRELLKHGSLRGFKLFQSSASNRQCFIRGYRLFILTKTKLTYQFWIPVGCLHRSGEVTERSFTSWQQPWPGVGSWTELQSRSWTLSPGPSQTFRISWWADDLNTFPTQFLIPCVTSPPVHVTTVDAERFIVWELFILDVKSSISEP